MAKGYTLSDAYKFYKNKTQSSIDKDTYRNICYDYNKNLTASILEGKFMKLPHRLGDLWIKKYKIDPEKPPVDLNESRKAGKTVYHLNFHSDGYMARWSWSKKNNLVTNLIYYSFHATRANSRALSAIMKKENGHKKYFS